MYPDVSGKYLLNGEWKEGKTTDRIVNPANFAEVVGEVAMCSQSEVNEAVAAAFAAYQTWSQTPIDERMKRMKEAANKLGAIIDELVPLFVRENGKPLVEAKKDLQRCLEILDKGADLLTEWWKPVLVDSTQQKVQVRRRPRGVTVVISPWNSPMILTFKRAIPAILAGNTVIVKPATNCPLTVMTALNVVESCLPPGVINIVTGSGPTVGDALCRDPRVRTIFFTGSTETGKHIMRTAADTVKKIYMELGGNDPALILDDAILDETTMQKVKNGVLRAAGQVCSAIKRIYVHESRYDEFVDKLKKQFERVVVGNGIHPDTTMGPLNNNNQYEFVKNLTERTRQSGAAVITLGQKLDSSAWDQGYFLLPSIVTGIEHNSELVKVEQFGPIIPVLPFKTAEEAIAMANDTEYGLRASVWTQNEERALEIADRLEAGAVFHNNHTIFQDLRLDFPGVKESGFSRETQWCSLDLFTDSYGFAN